MQMCLNCLALVTLFAHGRDMPRRYRKRGLAALATKFGISFTFQPMNQAGATVSIYLDGSVGLVHGGIEMGQGLHTKMCQVAAQELGVPLAVRCWLSLHSPGAVLAALRQGKQDWPLRTCAQGRICEATKVQLLCPHSRSAHTSERFTKRLAAAGGACRGDVDRQDPQRLPHRGLRLL